MTTHAKKIEDMKKNKVKHITTHQAEQSECKSTPILALPTPASCSTPKSGETTSDDDEEVYPTNLASNEDHHITSDCETEHDVLEITEKTTEGNTGAKSKTLSPLEQLEFEMGKS